MYFGTAGEPPKAPVRYALSEWPFEAYWTGIVFNGVKIGFTRLSLTPAEDEAGTFVIRSEAALRFRFLTYDKGVNLRSYDRVANDLSLQEFAYDYDLDGNKTKLSGKFREGRLEVEIVSQGQTTRQTFSVKGKLYPIGVIGMYPVLHGLEVGRDYQYQVYDGETQSIAMVTQEILAFEKSELFPGQAFKIKTRLHGQEVTTWIDLEGKPQLEISQGGVIISGLESETMAKQYLAQGTINKEEALLDFSLIKTEMAVAEPEQVTFMEVALRGIDKELDIPSDDFQQCERSGEEVICRINRRGIHSEDLNIAENPPESSAYLRSTHTVPSQHELVRTMANEIAAEAPTPCERVRVLIEWIQEHIDQEPVDVFTALDVLRRRKAECQGNTYLYAAFARALEIPTRVVNGIVFSENHGGFLYHAWAESLLNGQWVPVDPTLGQLPADGTHIKFVEGETVLDLMPMADLVGHLQVEIIAIENI